MLKEKFYKTTIRPSFLNNTECWAIKKQHIHKMQVVQIRMLSENIWKDRILNEDICSKIWVASINDKISKSCLRYFCHRANNAPLIGSNFFFFFQVEGAKKGRNRSKITLIRTLKNNM